MRTAVLLAGLAGAGLLALTACSKAQPPQSGAGATRTGPPGATGQATGPPGSGATPTTVSPAPGGPGPGAGPGSGPGAGAGSTQLGPAGLGPLRLGMTGAQAQATGMTTAFQSDTSSPACPTQARLRGGSNALVLLSTRLGVASIDAFEGVHTPEGIAIGSSLAQVRQAYPDLTGYGGGKVGEGRNLANVPGNATASYYIVIINGKVIGLTLQLKNQDCHR